MSHDAYGPSQEGLYLVAPPPAHTAELRPLDVSQTCDSSGNPAFAHRLTSGDVGASGLNYDYVTRRRWFDADVCLPTSVLDSVSTPHSERVRNGVFPFDTSIFQLLIQMPGLAQDSLHRQDVQ